VRPFRGVEARGVAELREGDVTAARTAIAGRDLGERDGGRFAAERKANRAFCSGSSPRPARPDLSELLPSS
jgi:hypothetical protein